MSEHDPYRAPEAHIAASTPLERLAVEPASRWRRFFTWAIDYVCFSAVSIVVVIPYATWLAINGDEAGLAAMEQSNLLRDYALGMFAMLLYYVPLEGLFGFTIGKLVTGTRVVNEQGDRPTWGQAFGRTLCRFIPFEPLSVLFAQDGKVRGWHDRVPGTWVVRRRR
jgi:uncharacterized RDD family membrane protein YckC